MHPSLPLCASKLSTFRPPYRYNIRDVFEIHQGESDPAEIGALVSAARKDLRTLQMLTKWDKQTWEFGFGKQ